MKICTQCKTEKPLVEFSKSSINPDGRQYKCKPCSNTASREARKRRLERNPDHDKKIKQVWYKKNREISLERARLYRINNPEWAKAANDKHHKSGYNWRKKFPERAKETSKRQAFLRKLKQYNLTPETFQAMIDKQDGKCAICGIVPSDGLVIDHNHSTNKVRELLCNRCNPAVGMVQENLQIAYNLISYLQKHSQ